jgi:hypothetical protein
LYLKDTEFRVVFEAYFVGSEPPVDVSALPLDVEKLTLMGRSEKSTFPWVVFNVVML